MKSFIVRSVIRFQDGMQMGNIVRNVMIHAWNVNYKKLQKKLNAQNVNLIYFLKIKIMISAFNVTLNLDSIQMI